ncbi:hypothetical protein K438DRAFT_528254 [Mycena galopus ATCC 62051]|nr:hypothetical protein K438DRAFT_528254 [Mycena galopus ATCC 62051]
MFGISFGLHVVLMRLLASESATILPKKSALQFESKPSAELKLPGNKSPLFKPQTPSKAGRSGTNTRPKPTPAYCGTFGFRPDEMCDERSRFWDRLVPPPTPLAQRNQRPGPSVEQDVWGVNDIRRLTGLAQLNVGASRESLAYPIFASSHMDFSLGFRTKQEQEPCKQQ